MLTGNDTEVDMHSNQLTLRQADGFSLIQLLTAVAVLIVVLTWGFPSFRTLILNMRITAQTNDFVSAVHLTRYEAFRRGTRVTMCKSPDGYHCSSAGDWGQGWIVFADPANNQAPPDPSAIIAAHEPLAGDNTLAGNRFVGNYLSYTGTGFSRLPSGAFQAGTLVLCDLRGFGEHARAIIINSQGRPRAIPAPESGKGSCFP